MYDDHAVARRHESMPTSTSCRATRELGRVTFRNVLAFQNFILMMGVIFGLQFVDRSFGPVLPLYVEQVGVAHARVPLVAGMLFSIMACSRRARPSFLRQAAATVSDPPGHRRRGGRRRQRLGPGCGESASGCMCVAAVLLGLGIGAAMTASYSAAGSVIPPRAHGAGFGVLTSASLVGMASSPFIAGFLGGTSIRVVFLRERRA